MIKRSNKKYMLNQKAQGLMEYTIVLGIAIMILFAMSSMIKRGTQSFVKTMADQIGVQKNSDQDFGQGGYLVKSYSSTDAVSDTVMKERLGVTSYTYGDSVISTSNSYSNLGIN